jgi:hypothetical protein
MKRGQVWQFGPCTYVVLRVDERTVTFEGDYGTYKVPRSHLRYGKKLV